MSAQTVKQLIVNRFEKSIGQAKFLQTYPYPGFLHTAVSSSKKMGHDGARLLVLFSYVDAMAGRKNVNPIQLRSNYSYWVDYRVNGMV